MPWKKTTILAAMLALGAGISRAEELKPLEEIPLPAHESSAAKTAQELAQPLSFSASQTKRVQRALEGEVDGKAERLARQYSIISDELREKRYALRDLIYSLRAIRDRLPDTVRAALPQEKKELFDPFIYEGRFQYDTPRLSVVPKAETGDEVVETTATMPDGTIVRKKIIIRRKRAPEAKPGADDSAESPAAEVHFESLIYTPQP